MKKLLGAALIGLSLASPLAPAHAQAVPDTPDALAAQIGTACAAGSSACLAAIQAAVALAQANPSASAVIGQGLALALAQLNQTNPALALQGLQIVASAPQAVQVAYQAAADTLTAATGGLPAVAGTAG